jgi:hypothetical protein
VDMDILLVIKIVMGLVAFGFVVVELLTADL